MAQSHPEGPDAGRLRRHDVFPVPVWTIDCAHLAEVLPELVDGVDRSLAAHTVPDVIGSMTRNDLQSLEGAGWDLYRSTVEGVCDAIAQGFSPPWVERRSFTWGIRYDSSDEFEDEEHALHSHARATLTSAMFISVPTVGGGDDSSAGALVLRNPQNHLLRRYGMDTYVHVPPVPLSMVVFPGFLEHFPQRPTIPGAFDVPRTLLVTDVHYY
ncbi:hypothetical protein [Dermatobacter hominis]|uniref:hypothetical protein n=1 Tax=Dermatobacter hominis TaxID=2884263 RepID=UPI001D10AB53|nr:hypothetical protein [Dermatobacter hominis]UDY33945.1 hypothetical protein LH044_11365 [Dermatobacter hominis]